MNNISPELIGLAAIFVTMVVGFATIFKFLFGIQDRITKLEIEIKTEITNLKMEMNNISNRIFNLEKEFGIVKEQYTIAKEQAIATNIKVEKLEVEVREQRSIITEIFEKFFETLRKNPVL